MPVRTPTTFNRCLCGGTKHLRDPETGLYTPCACLQEERKLKAYGVAGIPREYWHVDTNNFPSAVWYEQFKMLGMDVKGALENEEHPPRSTVLWGRSDSNKGLCAALLCKLFIQREMTARVIRSQRLLDAQFKREAVGEEMADPRKPDCLVIHLGEESPNKMLGGVLLDLYRERRDRGRFTAFTYVASLHALSEHYGYREALPLLQDERAFVWIGVDG